MTQRQHLDIRKLLDNDKGKEGRGLTLRDNYPPLGLLKGDRLEPWDGCTDISDFERIADFPARALFWRKSKERMAHHRNPIFSDDIGITPGKSCALDWLHILSLGVFRLGVRMLCIA